MDLSEEIAKTIYKLPSINEELLIEKVITEIQKTHILIDNQNLQTMIKNLKKRTETLWEEYTKYFSEATYYEYQYWKGFLDGLIGVDTLNIK